MITLPSPDEPNEETHNSEYCQHKFLYDVLETDIFENADAIIVSIAVGDEVIPFSWGDSNIQIRGLAEMTADFYRDSSTE